MGCRVAAFPPAGCSLQPAGNGSGQNLVGGGGERLAEAADILLEAPVLDAGAGALAHLLRCARSGEEFAQALGEGGDVADREEVALDAVCEQIGGTAAVVGGGDWFRRVLRS